MDVEKTIEFLLEWQAKFSADMEVMKENLAKQEEFQREAARRHEEGARRHEEWMLRLSEKVRRHDADLATHTHWLTGLSFRTQQIKP